MIFPDDDIDDKTFDLLASSKTTTLSDEFLAEIGRVVANFAILEREFFALIHGLLGTEVEVSRIATSELSFRNIIDLSASLVKHIHGDEEAKRYKKVLKLVTDAEEERNQIIHSLWGCYGRDDESVIRTKHTAKRGKGLTLQRDECTIDDLASIAHRIAKASLGIERFRERLGYGWA